MLASHKKNVHDHHLHQGYIYRNSDCDEYMVTGSLYIYLLSSCILIAFSMWDILNTLNTSKICVGFSMVLMQLGSRHVMGSLTEMQDIALASKFAQRIVLFCMLFVGTRDVLMSVVMTVAIHAMQTWFLNERSRACIVPKSARPAAAPPKNKALPASPAPREPREDETIAEEEYIAARDVVRRFEQGQRRLPPRLVPPMRTYWLDS